MKKRNILNFFILFWVVSAACFSCKSTETALVYDKKGKVIMNATLGTPERDLQYLNGMQRPVYVFYKKKAIPIEKFTKHKDLENYTITSILKKPAEIQQYTKQENIGYLIVLE